MEIRWNTSTCALEQSLDNGATWAAIPGWDLEALADCLEVDLPPQPIVRWNDSTCALEVSLDNGATYGAIPGWDIEGLAACLQTPLIDIGGAGGPGAPGPTIPPGGTTDSMACSIASWLAIQIIQGALQNAGTALAEGDSLLTFGTGLVGLALGFVEILSPVLAAAGVLFAAATALGASVINAAAGDAMLRGDLVCAIYSAIATAGAVTPSNVATILTNINAISYGTPGVVGMIHNYVAGLGFPGLNAIQAEGSLYAATCTCSGRTPTTNCLLLNGTDDYAGGGRFQFAWSGLPSGVYGPITVMMWVYRTSTTQYQTLFNNTGSDGGGPGHNDPNPGQVMVRMNDVITGVPWQFRGETNAFTAGFGQGGSSVSVGTWHLVTALWDRTDGALGFTGSIYIDNTSITITRTSGHLGTANDGSVLIGRESASDGFYYGGKISDIRIYNTLADAAMIAAVQAAGPGQFPVAGAPVAWWPCDEGSGTVLHDRAGGSNLTIHGSGGHWSTI